MVPLLSRVHLSLESISCLGNSSRRSIDELSLSTPRQLLQSTCLWVWCMLIIMNCLFSRVVIQLFLSGSGLANLGCLLMLRCRRLIAVLEGTNLSLSVLKLSLEAILKFLFDMKLLKVLLVVEGTENLLVLSLVVGNFLFLVSCRLFGKVIFELCFLLCGVKFVLVPLERARLPLSNGMLNLVKLMPGLGVDGLTHLLWKGPHLSPDTVCGLSQIVFPASIGTLMTFLWLKLTSGMVFAPVSALCMVVPMTRYMVLLLVNPILAPRGRIPMLTCDGLTARQRKHDGESSLGTSPLHVPTTVSARHESPKQWLPMKRHRLLPCCPVVVGWLTQFLTWVTEALVLILSRPRPTRCFIILMTCLVSDVVFSAQIEVLPVHSLKVTRGPYNVICRNLDPTRVVDAASPLRKWWWVGIPQKRPCMKNRDFVGYTIGARLVNRLLPTLARALILLFLRCACSLIRVMVVTEVSVLLWKLKAPSVQTLLMEATPSAVRWLKVTCVLTGDTL